MGTLLTQLSHSISARHDIPSEVQISRPCNLPEEVHLALYRIAQEALHNVGKHAGASCVNMLLQFEPNLVELVIEDDGRGFAVPESPAEITGSGHFGLLGIQERAEMMGARLLIESEPGEGTRLTISLPDAI